MTCSQHAKIVSSTTPKVYILSTRAFVEALRRTCGCGLPIGPPTGSLIIPGNANGSSIIIPTALPPTWKSRAFAPSLVIHHTLALLIVFGTRQLITTSGNVKRGPISSQRPILVEFRFSCWRSKYWEQIAGHKGLNHLSDRVSSHTLCREKPECGMSWPSYSSPNWDFNQPPSSPTDLVHLCMWPSLNNCLMQHQHVSWLLDSVFVICPYPPLWALRNTFDSDNFDATEATYWEERRVI